MIIRLGLGDEGGDELIQYGDIRNTQETDKR